MAEILKDTTANKIGTGTGGLVLDPSGTDVVTINNGVLIPDGTEAAPAVRFSDDSNTGIYSPANEQVAITGNGATVATFDGTAGTMTLSGLTYPAADGVANQVMGTDGAGNLSFVTVESGGTTGTLASIDFGTITGGGNANIDAGSLV